MIASPTASPCPTCEGESYEPLLRKVIGSDVLQLLRCSRCQTVRLVDFGGDGFAAELYAYYSRRTEWSRDRLYPPLTYARYTELLTWLGSHLDVRGGGRRVLDVGCGMGQFVDAAARAGWDARGIELAEGAVRVAERFDLPVRRLDFFSEDIQPGSVDLVTLFEVVEHLPCPRDFLRRAEEVVRPGGLVYLTTPNFASADRRLLGAAWDVIHREHLLYWTPATLRRLVCRSPGLRVVHVETRNISAAAVRQLALKLRLPIRAPRRKNGAEPASAGQDSERRLRSLSEANAATRLAKKAANRLLDRFELGNSLVMLLERSS